MFVLLVPCTQKVSQRLKMRQLKLKEDTRLLIIRLINSKNKLMLRRWLWQENISSTRRKIKQLKSIAKSSKSSRRILKKNNKRLRTSMVRYLNSILSSENLTSNCRRKMMSTRRQSQREISQALNSFVETTSQLFYHKK